MVSAEWERRLRFKADSEQIRRQNRSLVLETLRRYGKLARVELGRLTDLSPATITSISGDLIEEQIVRLADEGVQGAAKSGPGRPLVRLELDPGAALVLAVKVSIDEIEFAVADFAGTMLDRKVVHMPTFDVDPSSFGALLVHEAKTYLAQTKLDAGKLRHIGVAVQGFADMNQGSIVWSPAFKARNIAIAPPFMAAFKVSCSVANDANMIAAYLLSTELARFSGTAAVAYIGPGVGMGLVIGGSLYAGSSGSAAEFGHMNHVPDGPLCRCGRRGCVEAFAASYGIYRSATGHEHADAPHSAIPDEEMQALEVRAKAGEPQVVEAFRKAGLALGYGLSRVTALVSPEKIFVAGPGTRAFGLMEKSVQEGFEAGLVADLRQGLNLEVITWTKDVIIAGIVSGALRHLDREVFSRPGAAPSMQAAQ